MERSEVKRTFAMKKTLVVSFALLALLTAGTVGAQTTPSPIQIPDNITTAAELIQTIQTLTDWIFVIFLLFSVVFVLLAAFQFVTGGGDPNAVGQARQKLIWAAVGILVALMARAIPFVVANILGVNATQI